MSSVAHSGEGCWTTSSGLLCCSQRGWWHFQSTCNFSHQPVWPATTYISLRISTLFKGLNHGNSLIRGVPQIRSYSKTGSLTATFWVISTLFRHLCSPSIWPLDYPSIAFFNFISFFVPAYPPSHSIFYLVQNTKPLENQCNDCIFLSQVTYSHVPRIHR